MKGLFETWTLNLNIILKSRNEGIRGIKAMGKKVVKPTISLNQLFLLLIIILLNHLPKTRESCNSFHISKTVILDKLICGSFLLEVKNSVMRARLL